MAKAAACHHTAWVNPMNSVASWCDAITNDRVTKEASATKV
jgi:hypothetical protein